MWQKGNPAEDGVSQHLLFDDGLAEQVKCSFAAKRVELDHRRTETAGVEGRKQTFAEKVNGGIWYLLTGAAGVVRKNRQLVPRFGE
jgi:hypothetical protein